jgi:hypothetical protein
VSCIPKILELKGDKEFLPIIDPENKRERADHGLTVEGGGEYKGYHYLITFTGCAHRCGYVALPPDHPLSDEDLELTSNSPPEPYELLVHGGITFHGKGTHLLERLFPNQPLCEDVWLGFDAAHYQDGKDWEKHAKYYGEDCMKALSSCFEPIREFSRNEKVRTYKYMEKQCKNLIDQLIGEKEAA